MTLERNSGCCGGKGPAFSLSLTGDGAVEFVGTANVSELGQRRLSIPRTELRALYEEFARTDFFSLKDTYGMAWSGPPDSILTLELDGRSKRVTNRWRPGMKDGEPTQLQDQLWALAAVVIQTAGVEALISR